MPIFMVFGLTQLGIEPESIVSIADALIHSIANAVNAKAVNIRVANKSNKVYNIRGLDVVFEVEFL